MSVIVEFEVASGDFEFGRVIDVGRGVRIELETMVPAGEGAVPLFWVYDADREDFEERLRENAAVETLAAVDVFEDRILYAIDWDVAVNGVFDAIRECDGHMLNATGHTDKWYFEVRFPSHGDLSSFKERLDDAGAAFEVIRIYNPTKPDAGPWFGLTPDQREALVLAVERGYYNIPRKRSTVELADELGISDQAATERLRRAIVNLVSNTLVPADDESE